MSDTPRSDAVEDGRSGSPLDLDEYNKILEYARQLERELTAARKEIGGLRKDAERYRWLRSNSHVDWDCLYENVKVLFPLDADGFQDLSGAIDAAIEKERGEK